MKTENKIEAVIFDIGGVLLDFDHMLCCTKLATVCALTPKEVYRRLFTSGLEQEFDLGLQTEQFYSRALELLGATKSAISYNKFVSVWGDIFTEKDKITKVVQALTGRVRLFVLSNTNALHYSNILERFEYFNRCFEKSFLSFELKQRKPDPAIFTTVIEQIGLPPSSILYIDDMPEHIEAAKKTGIKAVLYTTTEALVQEFKSVGLCPVPTA